MAQVILNNGSAPSTPSAGNVTVYSKTDKNLYMKNDAGTEAQIATTTSVATSPCKLPTIGCTQSGGALTFSASSQYLDFRSTTLTDGTISTVLCAPSNLVLPSGGTLGAVTTVSARIVVVEINNAGTAELAIINITGGVDLSETGVINTTAISASSTANNIFYSTTARTGVAYRVVGAVDAVNTAGAWGNPTLVQGAGGMAIFNMKTASMVRVNTGNGFGSTNTVIRRFTNTVSNIGSDITYADSATLGGSFTINTSGVYSMEYTDSFSAQNILGISVNSTQLTTYILNITAADRLTQTMLALANYPTSVSVTCYLPAGAVVRAHTNTGISNGTFGIADFTITRVD